MGIYDRQATAYTNSLARLAEDRRTLIADNPTVITRERKAFADKMRASVVSTAGPYTVRIDQFRTTRNAVTFDEKGTTATLPFLLLGVDIPAVQGDGSATFRVDDTLLDDQGNRYRVTSPPRFLSGTVEVNIEVVA